MPGPTEGRQCCARRPRPLDPRGPAGRTERVGWGWVAARGGCAAPPLLLVGLLTPWHRHFPPLGSHQCASHCNSVNAGHVEQQVGGIHHSHAGVQPRQLQRAGQGQASVCVASSVAVTTEHVSMRLVSKPRAQRVWAAEAAWRAAARPALPTFFSGSAPADGGSSNVSATCAAHTPGHASNAGCGYSTLPVT